MIRNYKYFPCGKWNVMNTTIPAGSRAGARPCGAYWAGITDRVYCKKCWIVH